jgi:hypothetical protein
MAGTENDVLDRLQFQYEARGFTFDRRPHRADLPDFFEGYVPDALARKDRETVVIEVKSRTPDPAIAAQVGKIAERIRQQPGYRFELVVADVTSPSSGNLGSDDKVLSGRLRTARDLLASGDQESALLVAWSALEGAVRARLGADSRSLQKALTSRSLVSALVSFGLIEEEDEPALTSLADKRNRIAHGDTETSARPREVENLIHLAMQVLEAPRLEHAE